jgi:hypothetical protein
MNHKKLISFYVSIRYLYLVCVIRICPFSIMYLHSMRGIQLVGKCSQESGYHIRGRVSRST